MTRKQALIQLRDKIKAGGWVSNGGSDDSWLVIHAAGFKHLHQHFYKAWHKGSLDAADALHEAALPGWSWSLHSDACDEESQASVHFHEGDVHAHYSEFDRNPARAWLLAILEALIAQEPDT
jgi:hypothetical protein